MKDRFLKVLEDSQLTTTEFAFRIGVQPAQISHIKSGRNQITLDIVTKVLKAYPNISSDWLLFGNGDTYKKSLESSENQENIAKKAPVQLEMADLFADNPDTLSNESTENELKEKDNDVENVTTNSELPKSEENQKEEEKDSDNEKQNPVASITVNPEKKIEETPVQSSATNSKQEEIIQPKNNEESYSRKTPHHYVKKIVVFYSDKTYDEFLPNND